MARKRQLDPDFFADEEIAEFPFEGRLFYAGTWCFCEDTGVFEVKHKTLKTKVFPYDNIDTKPLYEQIRDKGKYIEYTVAGTIYAFIKGFHKRQTIQWPSLSYLPLPPEPFSKLIPPKIRNLNKSSMSPQCVLTEPSQRISRVELVELSRISREELDNFKKIFNSPKKLENHLKMRGFGEESIKDAVKECFPGHKV